MVNICYIIFALFYRITGGIISSNYRAIEPPPNINGLIESIYFSLITITTLGYGEFRPATAITRIMAGIETSIGLFIWALFLTVFTRRYLR